jgi:hypothetical protein
MFTWHRITYISARHTNFITNIITRISGNIRVNNVYVICNICPPIIPSARSLLCDLRILLLCEFRLWYFEVL